MKFPSDVSLMPDVPEVQECDASKDEQGTEP